MTAVKSSDVNAHLDVLGGFGGGVKDFVFPLKLDEVDKSIDSFWAFSSFSDASPETCLHSTSPPNSWLPFIVLLDELDKLSTKGCFLCLGACIGICLLRSLGGRGSGLSSDSHSPFSCWDSIFCIVPDLFNEWIIAETLLELDNFSFCGGGGGVPRLDLSAGLPPRTILFGNWEEWLCLLPRTLGRMTGPPFLNILSGFESSVGDKGAEMTAKENKQKRLCI